MAAERLSRFISILPDEEANKVVITSLDQFNNENELLFLACNAIEFDFTKTVASILSCGKLSRNSRSQLITFLIDFLTENNQAILSDTILARLLSDDYPTTQKIILADVNLAGCSKPLLTYLTNILLVNFDETILNEWITSPQRERVLNVIENLISDCYHKHLLLTLIPIIDNLLHFNEELFYHHQFTKEHAYLFLGEHQKQESLLLTLKNNAKVCDHLASNSLYDANADVRKIYLYHLKFGKAIAALAPHFQFNTNPIAHNKKLNIGIVMEDTNLNHPVFRFIAPLLQADYNQYQLIFFDCTKKPHDETLTYLKDKNHKINAIKDMTTRQFAKKIRDEEIDVLFDLSGLFGDSTEFRMSVFAAHPAPIQITYIAYPNTTGIPQMDYRLVDRISDPPGKTDCYYEEKLIRFEDSAFLCYQPDQYQLKAKINPISPSKQNNVITLGILNNPAKLCDAFLFDLSEMLKQIPKSRLCFQYVDFWTVTETCDHLLDRLHSLSHIPLNELKSRVVFAGEQPNRIEWISRFIDINIDPYPYNGTTTDFDMLLACVPTVTRTVEKRHEANVTASILTHLKMPELESCITHTSPDFVQAAVDLAQNVTLRDWLRENARLRECLLHSSLCDVEAHKEKLWRIVRDKWYVFCNTQGLKAQIKLPRDSKWEKLTDEALSAELQNENKIPSEEKYKIGLLAILQNKPMTLITLFGQIPDDYVADLIENLFLLKDNMNKTELIHQILNSPAISQFNNALIYSSNADIMKILMNDPVYTSRCNEINDTRVQNYLIKAGMLDHKMMNTTEPSRSDGVSKKIF